jgi:hypothetical protein
MRPSEVLTPVNDSACAGTTIDFIELTATGAAPLRVAGSGGMESPA